MLILLQQGDDKLGGELDYAAQEGVSPDRGEVAFDYRFDLLDWAYSGYCDEPDIPLLRRL